MPPNTPNFLLGGKLLTGVLPMEQQPPLQLFLPHHHQQLLDIESCIDDPSLAPLGHHVTSKKSLKKPSRKYKTGQVHIQRSGLSSNHGGAVVLRRRGLDNDQLAQELDAFSPSLLSPYLKIGYSFSDILELDISRNRLTHLPPQIVHLKRLRVLNATSNFLTHIPTELYSMQQLQTLNLSQNQIQSLPEEMPMRLRSLVTLRISANRIGQLPDHLDDWVHMKHLQLGSVYGGNQLTALPESVTNMVRLEELDVSNNQLEQLPDDFVIPSLISLNVSHNHLDSIPKSIAQCYHLKSLNVSKNHLTSLPSDLIHLRSLELFDVSENLLCIMPAEILETMASGALLITGNPLTRPGHCDLQTSSLDAYTSILRKMTQRAVSRSSSPIGSPLSQRKEPVQPFIDDEASIDRTLSYHAQKLNIQGARPTYTQHTTFSSTCVLPDPSSRECVLLNSPEEIVETELFPSLRELASRLLLQYPISHETLPDHLAQDLQSFKACSHCQGPFVNEWVTSVQVKGFGGHPAVVRRVRFCSTHCWRHCMPPEAKSVVCVHK
ncbi:hypothetical protein BY458DRAFT_502283 [Sporodiniella umbellata]|nr:hypothetical protein BY458DRAFT_502283 [Sporodiniella umbellata]